MSKITLLGDQFSKLYSKCSKDYLNCALKIPKFSNTPQYLLFRESRTLAGLKLAFRADPRSVILFVARVGPVEGKLSLC